jgi:protein-tyrosine-phosphatase
VIRLAAVDGGFDADRAKPDDDGGMKALFVCTGNMARSPMAAEIFRELAGRDASHVARAVGTASWAARRLTTRDLAWADVVGVMEPGHLAEIRRLWPDHAWKVRVLGVLDD